MATKPMTTNVIHVQYILYKMMQPDIYVKQIFSYYILYIIFSSWVISSIVIIQCCREKRGTRVMKGYLGTMERRAQR